MSDDKKEYNKKYREKNRDKLIEYSRRYYSENKEEFIRKYGDNKWYRENPEKAKQIRADYYQKNKENIKKKRVERYKNDIKFRITCILRGRLKESIRKYRDKGAKYKSAMVLLGCDMDEFIKYIESMFRDGMKWENYGDMWHIDHKMPINSFDMTNKEEQEKCFHYTNLQPLLAKENLSKGCKISV